MSRDDGRVLTKAINHVFHFSTSVRASHGLLLLNVHAEWFTIHSLTLSTGVRRAAQRKLDNELGIPQDQIDPLAFQYITRIHYLAPSDGTWGEHEVDYILFLQQDIPVKPNPEEIKDTRYVSQDELKALIEESKTNPEIKLTPWFALIADSHIWKWWTALLEGNLAQHRDGLVHHESD